VTTWGVVALVLAGIAVMGANVSALLPHSVLSGLHKTRIEGASLEHLRSQVADLREETQRLKRETSTLTTRFALDQQQGSELIRRVGALEVSVPLLFDTQAPAQAIDRASVTASTRADPAQVFEAEGGSVAIQRQPISGAVPDQPLPAPLRQAMPSPAVKHTYGIALGPSVAAEQAPETWRDLSTHLGPLLFGLAPMLADKAGSEEKRILLGPIDQLSEASALCARLERLSVSCLPMPFTGTPLVY
jgi:hypothetical protein